MPCCCCESVPKCPRFLDLLEWALGPACTSTMQGQLGSCMGQGGSIRLAKVFGGWCSAELRAWRQGAFLVTFPACVHRVSSCVRCPPVCMALGNTFRECVCPKPCMPCTHVAGWGLWVRGCLCSKLAHQLVPSATSQTGMGVRFVRCAWWQLRTHANRRCSSKGLQARGWSSSILDSPGLASRLPRHVAV